MFICPEQGFLEMQGNECSFNNKNDKARVHIMEQGKMREKKSKRAKSRKK